MRSLLKHACDCLGSEILIMSALRDCFQTALVHLHEACAVCLTSMQCQFDLGGMLAGLV